MPTMSPLRPLRATLVSGYSGIVMMPSRTSVASILWSTMQGCGARSSWPHASIGLSDMHPERQQDVVEKQRVSLVGMAEGGQQQAPEAGSRDVVDAHAGLIVQIANARRVGLVSDRVQRRTRQIKKHSV